MPALSLDHWNVYCKDLKATVRFYERYVGLTDGDRPPFNFPLQQVFVHDPDGVMIELNFWHEADVPEIDKSDTLPGARAKKKPAAARKLVGAK